MVAYSFKSRFRPPIMAGTKVQTIRKVRIGRSRHAQPGEQMQLYTGMRTRQCQIIGTATCACVEQVEFDLRRWIVRYDGMTIRLPELNVFAQRDGFTGWPEMRQFWLTEHPETVLFIGMLIRWSDFKPGVST